MSLDEENRMLLVKKQMEQSSTAMQDAELLMNNNRLSAAAGRIYYSVFHAVSALLIQESIRVKSHKGAYAMFCMHYVNEGKVPQKYGKWYRDLEVLREESDYNCFYEVTIDDLQQYIAQAKEMIEAINQLINSPN